MYAVEDLLLGHGQNPFRRIGNHLAVGLEVFGGGEQTAESAFRLHRHEGFHNDGTAGIERVEHVVDIRYFL